MGQKIRQLSGSTVSIDRLPLTKRIPVSRRDWGYFSLRWLIPVALILYLFETGTMPRLTNGPALGVLITCVATNLIFLTLLFTDRSSRLLVVVLVGVDMMMALSVILLTEPALIWLALIPTMVAGFYFDWLAGLFVGVLMAATFFGFETFYEHPAEFGLSAALTGISLTLAGPLAALLARDDVEMNIVNDRFRDRARRVEQVARLAQEQMHVLYEMAEVLSKSKLDPKRVLSSAVSFALDSLERMGAPPPLYAAVLLFADAGIKGTVLRVARASLTVPPSDQEVQVKGQAGAIERALRFVEPTMCEDPEKDPDLREFESFRACKSVMVLPLRTGDESYGVMCVGSREANAFKDTHIELMAAVTNQISVSLNNVRLFSALLEERDRIVQIERDARAQLASELHDGPTQGIAAITMRLNYIRKLIEKKPESAVDELYNIEDMARRTTKEIRHMLFELRPKALDSGLKAGLEQLAVKMKETYDQNVVVVMRDGLDHQLDTQTTQTLFSIANEVVNNSRKHAQAERIIVDVSTDQEMLVLNITDNGVGFNVQKALQDARQREGHLGLINLQERAALLDGALHIDSAPGQGTRTTVVVPLEVIKLRKEEELSRAQEASDRLVARTAP